MPTTSSAYAALPEESAQTSAAPETSDAVLDSTANQTVFESRSEDYVDIRLGADALYDLARASSAAVIARTADYVFMTPMYRWTLHGAMPDHTVYKVQELRPGRLRVADGIFEGRYALGSGTVECGTEMPWHVTPPNIAWVEEVNGFDWLRHLSASKSDFAEEHAHRLIDSWLKTNGGWESIAWRPHVIGRRLLSWFSNSDLIFHNCDVVWRSALMVNIGRQARHLKRTARYAANGEPRLISAIGLAMSGVCLSDGEKRLRSGMKLLLKELDRQILPDGGHVSRCPSTQLSILLDIVSLRSALTARDLEVPDRLQTTIDRMTPMVRFFRHGDGRLALFNGSSEEIDGASDAVLSRDDIKGRPLGHARHSGYQRLSAGKTLVLFDGGTPPRGRYSQRMHAGCLAFEMSVGAHRLIVNCGATNERGQTWRMASRATAAHSTLGLDDTSSAAFLWGQFWTRLLGERLISGPESIVNHRVEESDATWVMAAHDGYGAEYGLIHERRMYLDDQGDDLRGHDRLYASEDADDDRDEDIPFTVRFHLHPDVRASMARDGESILLVLPNREGWRFRAHGGKVAIEPSIYLGRPGPIRRCEQIVVTGIAKARGQVAADIKWAVHRLAAKAGAKQVKTAKEQGK